MLSMQVTHISTMIEILNAAFVSICFAYAALSDSKTKRVPNKLWLLMLPFALVSLYFRAPPLSEGMGLIITYCIVYVFWFYGWWGAADTKGIMIFALFYPDIVYVPISLWVMLLACLFLIVQKLVRKEKLDIARPFFPALCISSILMIIVKLLSF